MKTRGSESIIQIQRGALTQVVLCVGGVMACIPTSHSGGWGFDSHIRHSNLLGGWTTEPRVNTFIKVVTNIIILATY